MQVKDTIGKGITFRNVFYFFLSFLFFLWDHRLFSVPFEGNSSAPADCCGVDSALLLTSCFESLVLEFRRLKGCPSMEFESCRIVQRCGETYHRSSSWTSAGMWRIQAVSPFNKPLLWDEHITWNMFTSSLPAGQMKMWRLQDSVVLSQLITILTVNSSGEIQSCSVPWNLNSKLKQHFFLLVFPCCIFLLCHCGLSDKLWLSQEKCSSWGITKMCGSARNCQSHRAVPVLLLKSQDVSIIADLL